MSALRQGRYALRLCGEALGAEFPIDHPAIRAIINRNKRHAPKSAPALKTEYAAALETKANDSESPGGICLYASVFTLLPATSLMFGDVRAVQEVWVANTDLRGISTESKDKAGG